MQYLYFFTFLIINFLGLAIGSSFMKNEHKSNWYLTLNKAPWTPPGWTFGLIWTLLMVSYSYYLHLIIELKGFDWVFSTLFIIAFLLNVSWNYWFFRVKKFGIALLVLLSLTFTILLFAIYYFNEVGVSTTLFIIPYVIWLLIASSLNMYVVLKN